MFCFLMHSQGRNSFQQFLKYPRKPNVVQIKILFLSSLVIVCHSSWLRHSPSSWSERDNLLQMLPPCNVTLRWGSNLSIILKLSIQNILLYWLIIQNHSKLPVYVCVCVLCCVYVQVFVCFCVYGTCAGICVHLCVWYMCSYLCVHVC